MLLQKKSVDRQCNHDLISTYINKLQNPNKYLRKFEAASDEMNE